MLILKDINKKFKNDDANVLSNINLNIKNGDIIGLLGKNGAGKTTLMKIIAKTKKPSSGTIYINDINIFENDDVLKKVGIMIDTVHYEHLSAKQNLQYFLKVNNQTEYLENIDKMLELVGLLNTKNKKVKNFSFGMKQRLSLAMCLLTEPDLAIMDEPFVGLDPNGVKVLINSLRKWVENRSISLLISSHQLSELEEVCNKFVILKDGKLHNVHLDRDAGVKIIVKQDIDDDDTTDLLNEFPVITKIQKNSIYVSEKTSDFNKLIQKIMSKYDLVTIDNQSRDLYDVFDDIENREGI